jgi:hypothetical protein
MDNVIEKPVNPLLDKIKMPGETFALPSGGLFYDEGVLAPDVVNAEIYVNPMTTLDEITMKSPDLLFSGKAVTEVFSRCIPQVLDPGRMLSKDVDFLLACLRKVSYGDEMTIEYTHDCEDAKSHSYIVDVAQFVLGAKKINPTTVKEEFSVIFPNNQVADFQPVLFKDYLNIMQTLSASTEGDSPEKIRDEMVKSLSGLIRKVDDVTDNDMIVEWLKGVPPRFMTIMNEKIESVSSWGADFTAEVVCLDCGKKVKAEIPLNPLSFFM